MPLQGHGRSAFEMTNGRPLCPACRVPMWIVYINERDADDQCSFECPRCGQVNTGRRTPITLKLIRSTR
jgi:transposase-like protein